MSTKSGPFGPTGRLRGCSVYLLLVADEGRAFIKFGISAEPASQIRALIASSPLPLITVAACNLPSREIARSALYAVRAAFAAWTAERAGWYRFQVEEKPIFNTTLKCSLAQFDSPSWPVRWVSLYGQKINSQKEILAQAATS